MKTGRLLFGAILLALVSAVLAPLLSPLAWAVILAHATWPLYRRVRAAMGGRRAASAALMTLAVAAALIAPVLWMLFALREDVQHLYRLGQPWLDRGVGDVLGTLSRAPWIGATLAAWVTELLAPPQTVREVLGDLARQAGSQVLALLGSLGRNTVKFALALLFLFFVFRDGECMLAQARPRLARDSQQLFDHCLVITSRTTHAITRTVAVVALLQGSLAALAYWVVGIPAPMLLGLATALASLIPAIGTLLVVGPVAAWLLLSGHAWQGIGLLVWTALVIHPFDNVLRPWFVSSGAHLPFLAAFIGVLGGLAAFGLVGIFLGPVIVAVALGLTEFDSARTA